MKNYKLAKAKPCVLKKLFHKCFMSETRYEECISIFKILFTRKILEKVLKNSSGKKERKC